MTGFDDRERGDLEPVGAVLDDVLGRFAGQAPATGLELRERWEAIAGPEWAACTPLRVDGNGVLTVEVPGGAAASRLRFDQSRLVVRIQESLGEAAVRSVRLKVARNRA